ncbi:MAG: radical SAM protein [Cyanobacteria bacterium]|nr:radical SAM protein [Cyanobacteriota bacterium]
MPPMLIPLANKQSASVQEKFPGTPLQEPPVQDIAVFDDTLALLDLKPASVWRAMSDEERAPYLGVDLSRYPHLFGRKQWEPIQTRQDRHIYIPLMKSYTKQLLGLTPSPFMLTHIVTTRCNYSCDFCCFADSLNKKTQELTLPEIEKAYATIGGNLNVLVYSGGETTLNRQLPEIIEAAYRLTSVKSIYIISNAWKPDLLFEITHRIMQRCPGLHLTWSLSVEGPRNHNNTVRYTKATQWDAWQNTVDTLFGLKAMREQFGYTELDAQLCTVCTPDNYQILPAWYEIVKNILQPDKWNLNLMRRSVQMSEHQLSPLAERRQKHMGLVKEANKSIKPLLKEPFEDAYLSLTEQIRADVLSGELKFLYHTKSRIDGALKSAVDLISQEENRRVVRQEDPSFCCKAGMFGAFIGSEGQVSGCEEFALNPLENKAFGNLRETHGDFQAIWHSDKAREYRQMVGKARECHGCTLESQKNYPSILVSFNGLMRAKNLAPQIAG